MARPRKTDKKRTTSVSMNDETRALAGMVSEHYNWSFSQLFQVLIHREAEKLKLKGKGKKKADCDCQPERVLV